MPRGGHACAERLFCTNARDGGDSGYVERLFTNGAPYALSSCACGVSIFASVPEL